MLDESWKEEERRQSRGRLVIYTALAALLLLYIGSQLLKNRFIFYPNNTVYATPANYNLEYEEFRLKTKSGYEVRAWYIPAKTPDSLTMLAFSGNGGNITALTGRLAAFHEQSFAVMAVDYPGYGPSDGRPSEKKTYESAVAAWDYLIGTGRAKADNLVIYGYSLGGAVAAWLASSGRPYGALILDSTFTKLSDVPSSGAPVLTPLFKLILGGAYDSKSGLKKIKAPLLVLHCRDDQVVPYALGRELFESYGGPKKMLTADSGGHGCFDANMEPCLKAIGEITTGVGPEINIDWSGM